VFYPQITKKMEMILMVEENRKIIASKLSYKPLLKLLVDREMNTTELAKQAGISSSTMAEIRAHRSVTLETILKICVALGCNIENVVEVEFEYEPTDDVGVE
jgi:putative transcriptional regulator